MNAPELEKFLSEPKDQLAEAIATGVRTHVASLYSSGIEFYGYAIHTGEGHQNHSIAIAYTDGGTIPVPESDPMYIYYRYSVDEWPHYDQSPEPFAAANQMIQESNARFASLHSKAEDDFVYDQFETAQSASILEAMIAGLEIAKNRGDFGANNPFLAVWISDSESSIHADSVSRLNPQPVVNEFMTEFE